MSGDCLIWLLTNHHGEMGKHPSHLALFMRQCHRNEVEAKSFNYALSCRQPERACLYTYSLYHGPVARGWGLQCIYFSVVPRHLKTSDSTV